MGVLKFDCQTKEDFDVVINALNDNESKDIEDSIFINCQSLNEDESSQLLAALLDYNAPQLNITFAQSNDALEQQFISVLRSTTEQFQTIELNFNGMVVKLGKQAQENEPDLSNQLLGLTSQLSNLGLSTLSGLRQTLYDNTPFIPGFDSSMLRQLNCFAQPDLEEEHRPAPTIENKKTQ